MSDYLTTVRGSLMASSVGEIFSHSLALQSNAEPSAVSADLAAAWDSAWAGPGGAIANLFPASVEYLEVTAAFILQRALPDPQVAAAYHTALPLGSIGTNATGAVPSQNAVAVSLVGGQRPNGAPFKGRFYLPGVARDGIDTASGLLVPAVQTQLLEAMVGFVSALAAQGHVACIWSRALGVLTPVDTIRVGNRMDTIRRRRNRGAESYVDTQL